MKIDGKSYVPNYEYTPEAYDQAEAKLENVLKTCI